MFGSGIRRLGQRRLDSRANLRPPSRSASVIDRLLKNQNPLENCNNFDHPRRSRSWADVRRTAPQFCGLKFMDTGAMAVPIADVRLGHSMTRRETAGGRRLARTPPRRVTRWLAASTIAPPAPALSSVGDDFRPHHVILDRKVAARLFRRCLRPVEARMIPDSYVSSIGSAPKLRPSELRVRPGSWLKQTT